MSQSQSTSFVLSQSGYSQTVRNSVSQSSGNITVSFQISGGSAAITTEGIAGPKTGAAQDIGNQAGSAILLDSVSSSVNVTNRSISVSQLFDAFRFTATYASGVSVSGSVQLTGSGAIAFSSSNLSAFQTYSGA